MVLTPKTTGRKTLTEKATAFDPGWVFECILYAFNALYEVWYEERPQIVQLHGP